jgi:hypothetical protein
VLSVQFTRGQCEHLHPLIHAGQASPVWRQSPVCCLPQKKAKISSSLFCRLLHRVWCTSCRARASFMRYACMYPARLFLLETPIDICSAEDRASEDEAVRASPASSIAISARRKTLNQRAVSACSARSPRALRRKLQNSAGQCSAHAALQQALHSTARLTSANNNPTYAYILLDQTNMK